MPSRRQFLQAAAAGVLSASTQAPQILQAQTVPRDRLLAIPGPGRLRVVLDTDTYNEIDDQYAVAYSLLSPERMSVEAIYAAPFVNDRSASAAEWMEKSYEEMLRLLSFFSDVDKRIALRGSNRYFERKDRPVDSPAARDLIERALRPGDGPLYVLTIGGPVNVSSAILMEPKIKEKIVVVWLGGTPSYWPSATEFNLRQAVIAAQVLFDSGVPLVQVPTKNVSEHLRTTLPELDLHLRGRSRIGDYLYGAVPAIFRRAHEQAGPGRRISVLQGDLGYLSSRVAEQPGVGALRDRAQPCADRRHALGTCRGSP